MRTVSVTTSVPEQVGDEQVIQVLESLLDLWAGTWGEPADGAVLTVLWCEPGDSDALVATAAPRALPFSFAEPAEPAEPADDLTPVVLVVTDDAAAGSDPRAWCEIERRRPVTG